MSDAPQKTRSSSKPWLIGCAVVLVLLILCGGGLAWLGSKGWNAFQAEFERAAHIEQVVQEAIMPAEGAPLDAFAPQSVGGYELTTADDQAAFPALGLEADGYHAVYEQGSDTVEVSVYRMDETEQSATFDEIIRRIDDDERFQSNTHVRLPRTLRFSIAPPELHGELWHVGGWLIFARSATVQDLTPFLEAYLESLATITTTAEPEPPSEPTPALDADPTNEPPQDNEPEPAGDANSEASR